jgi:lincosamide nucleotidyltransferase A/C/D/E
VNRPSLWIKITHGVNVFIWRLPLSHRAKRLLSGSVYRNPPMSAARAVETLAALERANVALCCMGGWGIDALVGQQSRKHHDLDLIIERKSRETALQALAGLGYRTWYEQAGDEPLEDRIVVRDAAMRVVDVHPVDFDETDLSIASGSIEGHPVRCISAEQQFHSHQGFRKRLLHERRSQRSNREVAQRALETEAGAAE